MNNRRYRKIRFDDEFLRYRTLTLEEFKIIFEQLPKDAGIISWGQEWATMTAWMIVESDSYAIVSESQEIPEQIIVFKKQSENNNIFTAGSLYSYTNENHSALFDDLVDQVSKSTPYNKCKHSYSFYQGLNDQFEYCTKCNSKK